MIHPLTTYPQVDAKYFVTPAFLSSDQNQVVHVGTWDDPASYIQARRQGIGTNKLWLKCRWPNQPSGVYACCDIEIKVVNACNISFKQAGVQCQIMEPTTYDFNARTDIGDGTTYTNTGTTTLTIRIVKSINTAGEDLEMTIEATTTNWVLVNFYNTTLFDKPINPGLTAFNSQVVNIFKTPDGTLAETVNTDQNGLPYWHRIDYKGAANNHINAAYNNNLDPNKTGCVMSVGLVPSAGKTLTWKSGTATCKTYNNKFLIERMNNITWGTGNEISFGHATIPDCKIVKSWAWR